MCTCVKCTHIRAIAPGKGQGITSSVSADLLIWGRISLLFANYPVHQARRPTSFQRQSCPCLSSHYGVRHALLCPALQEFWGIWTLILMLVQQVIYPLYHLASPSGSSYIAYIDERQWHPWVHLVLKHCELICVVQTWFASNHNKPFPLFFCMESVRLFSLTMMHRYWTMEKEKGNPKVFQQHGKPLTPFGNAEIMAAIVYHRMQKAKRQSQNGTQEEKHMTLQKKKKKTSPSVSLNYWTSTACCGMKVVMVTEMM